MTRDEHSLAAFKRCYAAIQQAADKASAMAGANGKPTVLCECQVHTLKRLLREALCASDSIAATHDGRRV